MSEGGGLTNGAGPVRLADRALADRAVMAVELLLWLALGLALARLLWAVVTPAGPVGRSQAARPPAELGVLGRFDPFFRTRSAGAETVSALDLTLLGTRVDEASGRGSAILALPDETQASFAVGDEILPGVRLVAVAFDQVVLDNGGARETLFLDQSGPVPGPASMAAVDAPAAVPADELPRLGADVQAVPRLEGGRITGLVLSPRGSGAAFRAAGLKPGDVLLAVGGADVATLGDPAALVRRLDAGGLVLDIERAGARLTISLGQGGRAA